MPIQLPTAHRRPDKNYFDLMLLPFFDTLVLWPKAGIAFWKRLASCPNKTIFFYYDFPF
jgi:hypothetical protein